MVTAVTPPLRDVVFPAIVEHDGAVLRAVKVFLAADRVWVWRDNGAQPALALDLPIAATAVSPGRHYELTGPGGVVTRVAPGGGCGCGSKLRSFNMPGPLMEGT